MKEIEEFFINDINNREKMSKKLSKYMTTLHYTDKALLVLSGASNDVSLCSFTTAIDAPVVIASANICLVFLTSNGNLKTFLKTMGKKKNKKNCFISKNQTEYHTKNNIQGADRF